MQVQSITNADNFRGSFEVNPLFNKFKEELTPEQKDIFAKLIKKIENRPDGRIFKFDRVNENTKGAEVGIFEKVALIDRTTWMPLFCTTREKAAQCFKELNNLYKDFQKTKFDGYKN